MQQLSSLEPFDSSRVKDLALGETPGSHKSIRVSLNGGSASLQMFTDKWEPEPEYVFTESGSYYFPVHLSVQLRPVLADGAEFFIL